MNLKPPGVPGRIERAVALLLAIAFVWAGWKILRSPPAENFAPVPQQSGAVQSPEQVATRAGQRKPSLSPDGRFRFDARFVSASPGQAVHAPSVVELKDGRLRAVWFSGSREGAGDVAIQTAVLDINGSGWNGESTLFNRQQIQQGLWRYVKKLGNPVIARAPDGSLSLWMVNVSLGGWAGSAITWARSTDEGVTWSEPRRLVSSPFLNISTLVKGAPFAYQGGQTGLPVYHEFLTKFSEILRINSQGQVVDKIRIPASHTSLQPVVLVAAPERAQIYMRSGNARALMTSGTADAGRHWSSVQASSWPNPDSALAGVVSQTGMQWIALNPSSTNRETLALLATTAGGSFEGVPLWVVEASPQPGSRLLLGDYQRLLTRELRAQGATEMQAQAYVASAQRQLCGAETCSQEFSYPFLLQSGDGTLHLLYTWHRTRIKHIQLDPLQALHSSQPLPAAPAASNHVATPH